jgi:hypothetical protein
MSEPENKKQCIEMDTTVDILSMDTTVDINSIKIIDVHSIDTTSNIPICSNPAMDIDIITIEDLIKQINSILEEAIPLQRILRPLLSLTQEVSSQEEFMEITQELIDKFNIKTEILLGKLMLYIPSNIFNIETIVLINTGNSQFPTYFFALCLNEIEYTFDYQLSTSIMLRILYLIISKCLDNPFTPTIVFSKSNYSVCSGITGEYETVNADAAIIQNGPNKGLIVPSPFDEEFISFDEKEMTSIFKVSSGELALYKFTYIYPVYRANAIGDVNPPDGITKCTDCWEWAYVNDI